MPLHNQDQLALDQRVEPAFDSYRKKDVNPLSGVTKWRTIHKPNASMKQLQTVLRNEIRSLKIELPFATAVLAGSSIMGHVRPHIGHQYVVQYDIKDAFGSVQPQALRQLFSRYGDRGGWIGEVAIRYAMLPGHGLITGAGAAQDLFNIYAGLLIDAQLQPLLSGWGGITYTRYLDDLVFSSDKPIGRRRRSEILEVIRRAGFELADHKSHVSDLIQDSHVVVNGVGIRLTGDIFISRKFKRRLFALVRKVENDEAPLQLLAGPMGAFYAVVGKNPYSASERRLNQRYQRLLEIWRNQPERIERKTAKRQMYLKRMRKTHKYEIRRRYRRGHPSNRWHTIRRPLSPPGGYTSPHQYGKIHPPAATDPRPRPQRRKDRRAPHRRRYDYLDP